MKFMTEVNARDVMCETHRKLIDDLLSIAPVYGVGPVRGKPSSSRNTPYTKQVEDITPMMGSLKLTPPEQGIEKIGYLDIPTHFPRKSY